MRTLYIIISALFFTISCSSKREIARQQLVDKINDKYMVEVTDPITNEGVPYYEFVYKLDIPAKSFSKGMTLKQIPVLVKNGVRTELDSIVLQGQAVKLTHFPEVRYREPFTKEWIYQVHITPDTEGAEMFIETYVEGCGNGFLLAPMSAPVSFTSMQMKEPRMVEAPKRAPFNGEVVGVSYFQLAKKNIITDPLYVEQFKNSLDKLIASPGLRIDEIIINVSCSPEGGEELNKKLALEREEMIKDYYYNTYELSRLKGLGVDRENVKYNIVPQNWEGLYTLIENSTVPNKGQIIESMKSTTGRAKDIKLINALGRYPIIRTQLLPQLRNAVIVIRYHIE